MRVEHIGDATLYCGDCRDVLATLAPSSVDSIVTDPPYGLKFMGKAWDHGVPGVDFWTAALRVAKPGAHLLAFGGTRTFHRLTCAIEDAGWEIRDCIMWVYASGFPKSHNVALSIDKTLGHPDRGHRIAVASRHHPDGTLEPNGEQLEAYDAKTPEAAEWEGWGTALKPSWEPIIVARKPLEGTVAANVLKYRTGAINVDGCRIDAEKPTGWGGGGTKLYDGGLSKDGGEARSTDLGRWPANLIHDGSEEVLALMPETDAASASMRGADRNGLVYGTYGLNDTVRGHNDNGGSAARFFYCAKASREDRDEGLDGFADVSGSAVTGREPGSAGAKASAYAGTTETPRKNIHPTVKPTDLMRYLVRLVTPPGGTCLDMFMGSGSTGKACKYEGFGFIGIDLEDAHVDIAKARIQYADKKAREQPELFKVERQPEREEPTLF